MYKKKTWTAGEYIIVKKHHSARYPGKTRRPKAEPTKESVSRHNDKMRAERLQLIIMANFGPGDLFVDLTYRKDRRPESIQEARAELKAFLRRIRMWAKKKGSEIRWIAATERGSRGGCHHHLLIGYIEGIAQAVSEMWVKGHPGFKHLYSEGAYESLAEYITKPETKDGTFGTRYSRSRNLVIPEPKVERISAITFSREPKAPRGYYIIKDSVTEGVNPSTGYLYQRYIMRRIRSGPEKDGP